MIISNRLQHLRSSGLLTVAALAAISLLPVTTFAAQRAGGGQVAELERQLEAVQRELAGALQQPSAQSAPVDPLTPAEATDFKGGPTMYDPMMEFVYELEGRSDMMQVQKLTETHRGRHMVLCVLSNPPVFKPADVINQAKPVVLIVNNVHGGEVAGKDAALIIMRNLLYGELRPLLDKVVVLVVPTINPDGMEARRRTNEQGFDLNRDYIKLESQEVHALVTQVINKWQPDIHVDTHHGGSAPYALVFQTNMNPAGEKRLMTLANEVIVPRIRRALRSEDYDGFWYSGPGRVNGVEGWRPTSVEPRKQHVYSNLANMVGFLFETPSNSHRVINNGTEVVAIPREERYRHQVRGQYLGQRELIRFAADEGELLRATVNQAKQHAIQIGADDSDEDDLIPLEYRQVAKYTDDFWVRRRATEEPGEEPQPDYELVHRPVFTKFETTRSTTRPWGYLLPPQLATVIPLLLDHNITIKRLSEPLTVEVETYYATEVEHANYFQGHYLKRIKAVKQTGEQTFPVGSFFIPSGQPKSNLISYLLEPETNDNLLTWNYLDDQVRVAQPRGEGTQGQRGAGVAGRRGRGGAAGGEGQARGGRGGRGGGQARGGRGGGAGRGGAAGQRQGRGRGGFGGRGQRGPGQLIPMHRLMKTTPMKGTLVRPFNDYQRRRFVKW